MTDIPVDTAVPHDEPVAEPIPVTDTPDELFDIGGIRRSAQPPTEEPVPGTETGLVPPPPETLAPQDQQPIAVVETECGFYVYLVNGHWLADGDLTKTIVKMRDASFDDFRHAAGTILADLQAHATAQAAMQLQMQQQVMQQQAQNAAEIARRTGINPSGALDLSQLKRQ